MPPLNETNTTVGDGDDVVVVGRDDMSNYNPEHILPEPPETILKIRSWLKPTPYDIAAGEYRKHLASHVAGTGGWLTSSTAYQSWLDDTEHGLLWIRGIPGSGKSVMAAKLIDELKESNPGCPVLFFFFRQIIDANHAPEALLRDWMDQLLHYSPPLQKQLASYVERGRSVDSFSMDDLWKDLRMAFADLPDKVFCVGDALDEMDRGHDAFLQDLGKLGQWRPEKVKVLITSRPVPSVEMPLRNVPCLHLRLEERLVDVDISTYVRFALLTSSIPEKDWKVITDAVPGRANGLFLYAKLAMDAFLEPGARVDSVLAHLPQDLNALYTDLLNEHAKRSGIAPSIQRLILQSVTHAVRPLRLLELAEMIKVCSPDGASRDPKATKDLIRAACGPLLEILPDETVSVVHHSFTEYLKGTIRTDDAAGYPILHKGPVHAEIALACLRYLQSGYDDDIDSDDEDELRAWGGYVDSDPDLSGIDRSEAALRLQHPFFSYAASNWHRHIVNSESAGHDQADVSAEVRRFLGNRVHVMPWLTRRWPCRSPPRDSDLDMQLHIAAKVGLVSYTSKLLEEGANVDTVDTQNISPIWWAASEGHAAVIRELVAAGANPNQDVHTNGLTPLHVAAYSNHDEAVRALLEAGVDPLTKKTRENPGRMCGNAPRTTGDTPLLYACENGHLESLEAFLPFIKDIETVHRALAWAAKAGRPKLVARILQHPGVDVNAAVWGDTPLFLACAATDTESVKALLQAGADPNLGCVGGPDGDYEDEPVVDRGEEGASERLTCLHKICGEVSQGSLRPRLSLREDADAQRAIFFLLLDAGADINMHDPMGSTPLHYAVGRSPDLSRLLIDAGADPNATDRYGDSVLHNAKRLESIVLLIESGRTDINQRGDGGKTPLHRMLQSLQKEEVLKFLEYGPDCNIADNKGNTALHIAVSTQRSFGTAVVEALLQRGADPNLRNHKGLTPLLSIYYEDDFRKVGVLVAAGADINARDKSGAPLLFKPAHSNRSRSDEDAYGDTRTLIEHGADVLARDFDGRTFLHAAINDHEFSWGAPDRPESTMSRLEFITSLGLDVHATDHHGNGLLHELALRSQNHDQGRGTSVTALWKGLVGLGLDLDLKNYAGRTPLHILCATSNQAKEPIPDKRAEMPIDFLISQTADVDAKDSDGVTALHLAVTSGQLYSKKLLDAGADPAAATHEGLTPLHLAARCRQSNVVGMLLDALRRRQGSLSAGSPPPSTSIPPSSNGKTTAELEPVLGVNAKVGRDRITPLYYACRSGRPETVALLLEAGANAKANNIFEACAGFEEEYDLWRNRRPSEEQRGNGGAMAIKVYDESRPSQQGGSYGRKSYEPAPVDDTRLDEIVDMLVEHGADITANRGYGESYYCLLEDAVENKMEYTAACLRRAKEGSLGNLMRPEPTYTPLAFSKYIDEHLRQASTEGLRDFKLAHPDASDQDLFRRFMLRREYHLVEELARIGAPFLLVSGKKETCRLGTLIQDGFVSLVDKVGTLAAASQLETGDWHFHGDKSRPGLWFAARDHTDPNSPQPFIVEAVSRNLPNMPVVRLLVEKYGVDVNEVRQEHAHHNGKKTRGRTSSALHIAAKGSCWWHVHQALPYLLKSGADIDARDTEGQTPLHVALSGGWSHPGPFGVEAAKALLDAGADVNAVDDKGKGCLAFAQHDGDMVKLLIDRGTPVTVDDVLVAIDVGNAPFLEALLSRDFDVNTCRVTAPKIEASSDESDGSSDFDIPTFFADAKLLHLFPLYHAAAKALVLPVGRNGSTSKQFNVNTRLVQALLDHGADPLLKFHREVSVFEETNPGSNPTTIVPEGHEECTILHDLFTKSVMVDQFLDVPGLDVNHRDAHGRTVLHAACRGFRGLDHVLGSKYSTGTNTDDSVTMLQRLLSLGANIRARDNLGWSVLHHIIGKVPHSRNPTRYKVSLGAVLALAPDLVNLPDADGQTPLHYAMACAAKCRKLEAATVLLSAGADPRAEDSGGNTPLHFLAYNLDTEPLRALFKDMVEKHGADVNARNSRGETPLFSFASRARNGGESLYTPYTGGYNPPGISEEGALAMLADLGADFSAWDVKGRGLLHFAAGGDLGRFRELVGVGLDVMAEDGAQRTAVDVAAACGNREVLKLFEKDGREGAGA